MYFVQEICIFNAHMCTHSQDVDMFWDFISLRPETTHQVSFLFSDRGIPNGYRHMNGYGSHTFKLVNEAGEAVYCKFHYKVCNFVLSQELVCCVCVCFTTRCVVSVVFCLSSLCVVYWIYCDIMPCTCVIHVKK